ncbi:hypothetical protein MANES_05G014758v8 [Manihot esculenta]|uniref:Uncharacterized protein n=1 Tax=Manihot esculenta TaxID=3983 RepID=A0ACB7HN75_MANES|nr:hypothetical protein MANES_05G014758v8 [Manihot esculenta]
MTVEYLKHFSTNLENNFVEEDADFILSLPVGVCKQNNRLSALSEKLPTSLAIHKRIQYIHPECMVCSQVEYIKHIFLESINNLVFRHIHQQPQDIIASALNHQDRFKAANTPSPHLFKILIASVLQVNFDAASDKFRNMDALAVILKDHNSRIIDWLCVPVTHILDPLILESMACREAVKSMACREAVSLARNRNINNLIVEGNCKVLFDGLCSGKEPL